MPTDPARYEEAVGRLLVRPPEHVTADRERVLTLTELLGRPDRAYPAIRVSGGDDARSVALMASALLSSLGLAAGCYLSSHLRDVRERIRVAGAPIGPDEFADRLAELEPFLAEVDARDRDPLDVAAALAGLVFAHFADKPVDVAVLDSGPAGLDGPMSLARAEVVVLAASDGGDDSAADLSARAGGVEEGGAVITGPLGAEAAAAVEEACRRQQARLVTISEAAVSERLLAVGGQQLHLQGQTADFDDVYLPLHGRSQAANAALALTAVEGLLGFAGGIDAEVIREGFAAVRVPGRIEVVRREDASTVVLDVAGTPTRAAALAASLREEFAFRHRVLVAEAGGAQAREAAEELAPLLELASHVVLVVAGEQGADPQALADAVGAGGISVETAEDVPTALELASGLAKEEDGVVVAGGPATVGAAREALGLGVA